MTTPAISLGEVDLPATAQHIDYIAQVDDATNHTIAKVVLQIIQSYIVPYQFSRCRTFVSQSLHLSCIGMCNRDGDLELAVIHSGGVNGNRYSRLSKGILSESFCKESRALLSANARMVIHRDHYWIYDNYTVAQFSSAPLNFARAMTIDGIFLSDPRSDTIMIGVGASGYRVIRLPENTSTLIYLGGRCLHVMGNEDGSPLAVAENGIYQVNEPSKPIPEIMVHGIFCDATSHPDGTHLFTVSEENCVVYNVSNWRNSTRFPLQGYNRSLSVCDSSMASLGNSSCRIWDIEAQRPLLTIPLPNTMNYSRCLLARSSLVVENDSAPPNRNILLFDTREPSSVNKSVE